MRFRKTLAVVFCLLVFGNLTIFSQGNADISKIKPSTILAEIIKKKKTNPKMSHRELAAYANQLLAKQGFNYSFNISELYDQKTPPREFVGEEKVHYANFPFDFMLQNGGKRTFDVTAKNLRNECFGETYPAFPLTQAAGGFATLIVEGKPNRIKIPKEFYALDAILVDTKTKKKALQRWILPYAYGLGSDNFVGISADGKKLYLTVEEGYESDEDVNEINELALEIGADGAIKFVSKSEAQQKIKWQFLNEASKLNDILASVTINGKVYIFAVPVISC